MAERPPWNKKNWKNILDSVSSPEDSDAEDELNVMQVQRNARRVAELMHQFVPGLGEGKSHLKGDTPMGMNNADLIREGLVASMRAQSQHSNERHSRNAVHAAAVARIFAGQRVAEILCRQAGVEAGEKQPLRFVRLERGRGPRRQTTLRAAAAAAGR